MKTHIEHHPWKIIEKGFQPERQRVSESLFSIGNGRMGQRANFEESYSGDSLQGSYLAGVYFPDKTRVGWWKNGYPEYFAKVINSVNWIGLDIEINGQPLDLAKAKLYDFYRELDMKEGVLRRSFTAKLPSGEKVKVKASRLLSLVRKDIGAVRYSIEALNFSGEISLLSYLDFDVVNEDSNYEEKFWEELSKEHFPAGARVSARTKQLDFQVAAAMQFQLKLDGTKVQKEMIPSARKKFVGQQLNVHVSEGKVLQIDKFAAVVSNFYHPEEEIDRLSKQQVAQAARSGFEQLYREQKEAWKENWIRNDIEIHGDEAAQQGIRFNIFQLFQTYTGEDERLNIGPKGFTGEKYGGSTYWDTEAYCLPFYLSTAGQQVARQLLLYRYRHLDKAIENAEKLGFSDGAALFPMVTMDGTECHNEWEITFEEIHRNGAMVYAIYNYIRETGDVEYMRDYGLELIIAVNRFWSQRIHFSHHRKKFVMLGVTGPNEYENNVNHNWYTNTMAKWCLQYGLHWVEKAEERWPEDIHRILRKTGLEKEELSRWKQIIDGLYLPQDPERGIFLQQEGFLDKELKNAASIPEKERPISQHWSWDRILRSCFIKQADVLQGVYFFEEEYSEEEIARNFDFYEPMTVHESSLSPCIHSILAARLGRMEKAYEMYIRTARLDLEDYNNDTAEGCHITSMAGTWMSIVEGFGGKRIREGALVLNPLLPKQWEAYSFRIIFRGATLQIKVTGEETELKLLEGASLEVEVYGKKYTLQRETIVRATSNQLAGIPKDE